MRETRDSPVLTCEATQRRASRLSVRLLCVPAKLTRRQRTVAVLIFNLLRLLQEPMKIRKATSQEDTVNLTDAAMVFSEGSVTVSSSKGYRTARSTLLVNEGAWYFEVVVAHLGDSGHVRVGWSTNMCELNAPVGFDEHGYGYCDVFGEKVHHRNREPYGEAYAAGDVLGCYIYIKPAESVTGTTKLELDCRDSVDRIDVEDCNTRTVQDDSLGESAERSHKTGAEANTFLADGADNCHSVEDADLEDEVEGTRQALAPTNPSSSIGNGGCVAFAKNGVFQGVAYHLTRRNGFSPTVSLFTLGKVEPVAKVAFNFGPDFVHALSDFGDLPSPKPLSETVSLGAVSVRKEEKSGTAEEISALKMNDTQES